MKSAAILKNEIGTHKPLFTSSNPTAAGNNIVNVQLDANCTPADLITIFFNK
jgi:hypothetical protein